MGGTCGSGCRDDDGWEWDLHEAILDSEEHGSVLQLAAGVE